MCVYTNKSRFTLKKAKEIKVCTPSKKFLASKQRNVSTIVRAPLSLLLPPPPDSSQRERERESGRGEKKSDTFPR